MQVWPRAACCDVRETERERGRKREDGGRSDGVEFTVSLHMDTYVCMSTHTHTHVYTHFC